MTSIYRLRIAWVSVAVGGISWSARPASAQTVLDSSSGPTATGGTTVNFTTAGTADWVYYGASTVGSAVTSTPGNEEAGNSLFSNISVTSPSPTGKYLNIGGDPATAGATITYSNGTSPTSPAKASANAIYVKNGGVGDGLTFTYQMPAETTQTLDLYLNSYDGSGELSVTSASSGLLFSQSSPVPLASTGTNGAGNGGGVYQFAISNLSSLTDSLTFTDVLGATNGGSASVQVEGVTVADDVAAAPEPTSLITLGLAAGPLLAMRRRRSLRSGTATGGA
jgi:hypothetical protein